MSFYPILSFFPSFLIFFCTFFFPSLNKHKNAYWLYRQYIGFLQNMNELVYLLSVDIQACK